MHLRYLLAGCCLLFSVCSAASDSRAFIGDSGSAYQGNLMLNQAAGEAHQQVNARAINPGAMPSLRVEQQNDRLPVGYVSTSMQAGIAGDAFTGGNGVLGINQSAGAANQQINSFRMGAGVRPESVDDSSLAQSAPLSSINSAAEPSETGERLVSIDDRAFTGSRGVVQLNQAAGVGNRMVNSLGIRME